MELAVPCLSQKVVSQEIFWSAPRESFPSNVVLLLLRGILQRVIEYSSLHKRYGIPFSSQMPLAEVLNERCEAVLNDLLGEKRSTPRNIRRCDWWRRACRRKPGQQ